MVNFYKYLILNNEHDASEHDASQNFDGSETDQAQNLDGTD